MAAQRDTELADAKLREPCRKALVSLNADVAGSFGWTRGLVVPTPQ